MKTHGLQRSLRLQVVGLKASALVQAGTDEAWPLSTSPNSFPDAFQPPLLKPHQTSCKVDCVRHFPASVLLHTLFLLPGMSLLHL